MSIDCVEEALEMQEEWCRWRYCDASAALVAENDAIVQVLECWDRLPELMGGAIWLDGHIVAYTVAEALDDEMLVVHFEKAHTNLDGCYQAINQQFLEHDGQGYSYVNREQDLDEEGLRRAKLSYNPVGFLKKFEVVFS